MTNTRLLLCTLIAWLAPFQTADAQSRGVVGRKAPAWTVDRWFNLPDGETALDVEALRGKVIYLYCFQSWCPGCHSRGFPTLKELSDRFADKDDVAFVAIQTTFEGFQSNTADRAKAMGERYDLDIPIAHSGTGNERSKVMRAYRTGGTPWTILIDKTGVVRFNDFHLTPAEGERRLNDLRAESTVQTLPKERGGQDVIGEHWPPPKFDTEPRKSTTKAKPKATLYRWWTNSCTWCEASLPAIELLRTRYEDDGLHTVGVYHPKPPRSVSDEVVRDLAAQLGYAGPLATDLDWSILQERYLSLAQRRATSVSFLVDENDVVQFVHPGPVFHPTENPAHAERQADFDKLEAAIRSLLGVSTDQPSAEASGESIGSRSDSGTN